MNKILFYRQKRNLTQTELSELSGLSLRTIQRIESGTVPKGHTLKSIAKALDVDITELSVQAAAETTVAPEIDVTSIKLLNLSALLFLVVPFGNLIFPFVIYTKNKKQVAIKAMGLAVLNIQIIWTFALSILLLISPIFQKIFDLRFSLLLTIFIVLAVLNIFIILYNAIALNKQQVLKIKSPIAIL